MAAPNMVTIDGVRYKHADAVRLGLLPTPQDDQESKPAAKPKQGKAKDKQAKALNKQGA